MAETKESLCCDTEEIHEELLKIVDETMPDETELDSLAELLRFSEILPESGSCLFFLKQRCVSVIWQER